MNMETDTSNTAAMREALEKINRLCGIGVVEVSSFEIGSICEAALSAPPRNCERFATVKDSAIAFAREHQDAPQPCPDFTFSAWLLAPAAKKEGEGK